MRILLTGAAGMIARAIRAQGRADHDWVLLDVSPAVCADGGVQASITDRDAVLRAAAGCDAIIHTAAVTRASFDGRPTHADYIDGNVIGLDNLCQAALAHGIRRVVSASTMEILWGESNYYGTRVLDETLSPRPESAYAVSKLLAEELAAYYARQHQLELVSLRYMAVQDRPVHEIGCALLSRRMTARDAASATLLAATTPGLHHEVLCLGPDSPLSQSDIDQACADPWPVLEKHWPGCGRVLRGRSLGPTPEDFFPVVTVERAKRILNWQPESRFENFLRHLGWTPATQGDPSARRPARCV